jgi:hypothetical protein
MRLKFLGYYPDKNWGPVPVGPSWVPTTFTPISESFYHSRTTPPVATMIQTSENQVLLTSTNGGERDT